ncbi:MAG: SOS response-associated peptidase, partial [Tateyamaria sp.]
IKRTDGAPLAFAAVWQDWSAKGSDDVPMRTAAIVTTGANTPMAAIHHRMPVVLEPEHIALWLGEQGKGAATLMRAAPDDALTWHRVSTSVNSNRARGPELIDPSED